jgi:hypothetical protein
VRSTDELFFILLKSALILQEWILNVSFLTILDWYNNKLHPNINKFYSFLICNMIFLCVLRQNAKEMHIKGLTCVCPPSHVFLPWRNWIDLRELLHCTFWKGFILCKYRTNRNTDGKYGDRQVQMLIEVFKNRHMEVLDFKNSTFCLFGALFSLCCSGSLYSCNLEFLETCTFYRPLEGYIEQSSLPSQDLYLIEAWKRKGSRIRTHDLTIYVRDALEQEIIFIDSKNK